MMSDSLSKEDDAIDFADEPIKITGNNHHGKEPWRILVVDDDDSVHQVTRLILSGHQFQGRSIILDHAYSGKQALEYLTENRDTSLILLDVIMETDTTGLDLVNKVRKKLEMTDLRILIRTGQPGIFNEYQIATDYDINDYIDKSSLTADKLLASITTLLREYASLKNLRKKQHEMESNLSHLNSFAQIFNDSQIATLMMDENLLTTTVNSAFIQLTGYEPESVIGKKPDFLISKKNDQKLMLAAWRNLQQSASWDGELWCQIKSGENINIHLTAIILDKNENNHSGIAIQFSNITDVKNQEKKLLLLATRDSLTSLPNRALFFERMEDEINMASRNGSQFAMLFIDLDYFKIVNDELGHSYGDKLLQQVAKRFQGCIRKSDMVARVGGDEFAVLITNLRDISKVKNISKKIIGAISRPFDLDGQIRSIEASIGIAIFPTDAMDSVQIYHLADLAMYQAKHNGRGTFCFYSSIEPSEKNAHLSIGT